MSIVVITGANAGIGRAAVREFAARGWDVALLAREEDRLEDAAAEVREHGGRALAIPVDVGDALAVEDAAARVEAELGPIDVWVNNAATSVMGPVLTLEPAEIKRVTDTTYHGAVFGTLSALRRMIARNRGTIVQVSSGLAYRSIPLQAPYCGAKAGIRAFTDSVRAELLHDKRDVKLSVVHLAAFNTPQFSWVRSRLARVPQPLPPVYQPELAANAIVWAAQHAPRELNVGWPVAVGRLLHGLVPGLMDRYVAATAWEGQQSKDPETTRRPDALDRPVGASVGAHGAFDDMAKERSVQMWLATHPRAVLAGALAGLAASLTALRIGRR